jgi:hypothetical protein
MQVHELLGLNEYYSSDVFVGEQVEIGSETIPLCLNHKIVTGWSTKNILVNCKDLADNMVMDKIAYLSDLPTSIVNSINDISGVATIVCGDGSIDITTDSNRIILCSTNVRSLNAISGEVELIGANDVTITNPLSNPNQLVIDCVSGYRSGNLNVTGDLNVTGMINMSNKYILAIDAFSHTLFL